MNVTRHKLFKYLIVYYWFLSVFVDYNPASYTNSGIKYYLLVVPVALFIIMNFDRIIKKKIRVESLLLILFVLTAIVFSIIKIDIESIIDITIWTLPLIIIFNSDYTVDLCLLNRLFILTIIAGVIYYHLGINDFGYLPGQTFRNLHQGLWWRISIFPYRTPPATGMFSLVVLFANYYNNSNQKSRLFFIAITLYFLVLSGSRTSVLILLIIMATFIIRKAIVIKGYVFTKVMTIIPVVLLLMIFIFPNILLKLNFENKLLNSLIFRSTSSLQNIEELQSTLNRQNIWQQYFDLYKESPIIGVHSDMVSTIGQTETMIMKYLAQFGISVFFLIIYFYRKAKVAVINKNDFAFSMISMAVILMIAYSSFLLPYNIIYLLIWSQINYSKNYV
ncbi:MAG: hypothetical protein K0R93_591 [Anaerosolibacter sp.]|jgi:O-antigen ligase|uniref:O-antigen ligase family protein n=1 Tax=Anaerosolibacter sp. TaxID=1872527 RepID=UPI00262E9D8D|nr:O-antigen ligase family protein [Anaerosolibacter sp.]MDF2545693.1 hypothetical protein [Anaerosolibacter sp.]